MTLETKQRRTEKECCSSALFERFYDINYSTNSIKSCKKGVYQVADASLLKAAVDHADSYAINNCNRRKNIKYLNVSTILLNVLKISMKSSKIISCQCAIVSLYGKNC